MITSSAPVSAAMLRKVLSQIERHEPLPRRATVFFAFGELAKLGLIAATRDENGAHVDWIPARCELFALLDPCHRECPDRNAAPFRVASTAIIKSHVELGVPPALPRELPTELRACLKCARVAILPRAAVRVVAPWLGEVPS